MVRIPGVCNHDPSTTVLAHLRRAGAGGTGLKPPDFLGVWACSCCHDVIDGRVAAEVGEGELDGMVLDGLIRTLMALDDMNAFAY